MTAVDVDALDKLREALAAEVRAFIVAAVGEDMGPGMTEQAEELTARLLPVVDRIANERAAAALEAAAADYLANTAFLDPMREMRRGDVATDLMWRASTTRARAAALRASNGEDHTCSRWCAQHAAVGGPLDRS